MRPLTFFFLHIFLTLALGAGFWFFLSRKFDGNDVWLIMTAFFLSAVISLLSYLVIYSGIRKKPGAFVSGVLISMMMKMGAGLAAILIVALEFKNFAVPFAVTYLAAYFLFTVPEVYFLMRSSKST